MKTKKIKNIKSIFSCWREHPAREYNLNHFLKNFAGTSETLALAGDKYSNSSPRKKEFHLTRKDLKEEQNLDLKLNKQMPKSQKSF